MLELVFAPCSPLAGGNTNWMTKTDEVSSPLSCHVLFSRDPMPNMRNFPSVGSAWERS